MKYDMKKPCEACPFKRGSKLVLREEAVEDVLGQFARGGRGEFPCHKTAKLDDEGNFTATPTSQHCAGALMFAEKTGGPTQMMRIAERLNMYKPDDTYAEEVYDDLDEALEAAQDFYAQRRKPKRKAARR